MSANVTFDGGSEYDRLIANAKKSAKAKGYDVGFYESSRYQDGTSVVTVAADHEFGIGVPERAFFRQANREVRKDLIKILKRHLQGGGVLDLRVVGVLAETHKGSIQESITRISSPPNSPQTIERKGSSNPLIDTGFMRSSATWKTNENR